MEIKLVALLLEYPDQLQQTFMDVQLTTSFMSGGSSPDIKLGHQKMNL